MPLMSDLYHGSKLLIVLYSIMIIYRPTKDTAKDYCFAN